MWYSSTGHLHNQDTLATVPALVFFAFGIVEQSATVILPRTFYALQDTWTPVLLSGITLLVNIVLMIVLIKPLAQGGLALAISISGIVNMLLLLYFLKRKIGLIDGRRILTSLSKILFASTIMGMAVWWVFRYTSTFADTNFWGSLINLVVGTSVGAVVFLILAVVLRMQELEYILQIARRKIAK